SSDQYAGHARDPGAYADFGPSADRICRDPDTGGPPIKIECKRQEMARLRLGGAVEFNASRHFAIWGIFEGILAQTSDHRRLYSSVLDFIGDRQPDIRIYPRLGITYKF
ncbi:MAG: hypothetical protein N2515_07070, partial [Deltaproteobacteria bacterium]|nr:hypothetical protein [Deltaproteobacteria bacterium]